MEKSRPLKRAQLANQIQGCRISRPAGEKNNWRSHKHCFPEHDVSNTGCTDGETYRSFVYSFSQVSSGVVSALSVYIM